MTYKAVRNRCILGEPDSTVLVSGVSYDEALAMAIDKADRITAKLQRISGEWRMEPHDEGATIFYGEDAQETFEVMEDA